jgi:hypothetical protein
MEKFGPKIIGGRHIASLEATSNLIMQPIKQAGVVHFDESGL